MKTKLLIALLSIAILSIFVVPCMAASEFPDMKGHWAGESVKVLTEKNIIAGWGGLFHPEDTVKANEYIKMVVTALGYTDIQNYPDNWARDYIGKAMELGLVVNGEIADFNKPINRGMMAKIAMRALQDENTPDYIMAYKGLVSDYEDLEANIRLDALKCIEKGIIKGMPDGSFRPEYHSTRAEAATVIHRMISQEEREKAKPIFATPDREFEAFMASADAENYCSVEYIHKVIDGKVIFGGTYQGSSGETLVKAWHNPTANKEAYELTKNLVNLARDYGYYVRLFMTSSGNAIWFRIYENKFFGERNPDTYGTNICFVLHFAPYKYSEQQKEDSYYTWAILSLVTDKTEDRAAVSYKEEGMLKSLESAFITIYGESLGIRLFDYTVLEYDKDTAALLKDEHYYNEVVGIRSDFDGLEVANGNGYGDLIYFTTNKK